METKQASRTSIDCRMYKSREFMMSIFRVIAVSAMIIILAAACVGAPSLVTSEPSATPSSTPSIVALPPTSSVATSTPSGAWVALTPQSGPPGTKVTVNGYLPGLTQNDLNQYANVCWDTCANGLQINGLPVTWDRNTPGKFNLQFTVPLAAWIGADGQHDLVDGDYSVGVQCIGVPVKGCALTESTLTASFHLRGAPARAQSREPYLSLQPSQAMPGVTVQVSGWAPLVEMSGDNEAFGYYLGLQVSGELINPLQLGSIKQTLDGTLSGSFQVPQYLPDGTPLDPGQYAVVLTYFPLSKTGKNIPPPTLAPTSLTIVAAQDWVALKLGPPTSIQAPDNPMEPVLAVDPKNDQRMAYCAPDAIQLSADGGNTWSLLPAAGVEDAAKSIGYSTGTQGNSGAGQCAAVLLDSEHPQSFYAIFQTVNPQYGAPPVYFMGFYTTDTGKTWKLVPTPSTDSSQEAFGGFWSDGNVVQALFVAGGQGPDQASSFRVMETTDGGATWKPGTLICPPDGPCLRFGPHPGSIGGMGSPLPSFVMASSDAGQTWNSTGFSVELRMPGPKELVGFNATTAALIDSGSSYPFQLTQDGGQTWRPISLPLLPDQSGSPYPFSGLQMMPDGSLLARSQDGTWRMLTPGAAQWCAVDMANLPKDNAINDVPRMQVLGDRVWWIPIGADHPISAPLAAFRCSP